MQSRRHTLIAGVVGLLTGIILTITLRLTAQAPPPFAPESPTFRGLDANLYMQTAAEYRACCYQAYNLATRRLKERHEGLRAEGKKFAVVMDLDETVLDNGGFQAMMLRSGLAFDLRLWDLWEEKQGDLVGLVPGAKDFIRVAEHLGVAIVYISNRSDTSRKAATRMLERLQVGVKDPKHLMLRTGTGDKTQRRKEVEAEFTVLLYVGDNLRDFDEQFKSVVDNTKENRTTDSAKLVAAIQERKEKVDGTRDKWGREWIILPNPAYGEWMRPLNLGRKDLDRLAPTVPTKQ